MWVHAVNGATDRLGCSKNLLHAAGELTGHGARPHHSGSIDDIIHGDVTVVLDVLHFLPVPWGFLQGLDDESRSRRNDCNRGLSVLDLQLDGDLQTFPVTSCLSDVISNLLGGKTKGTDLWRE